MLVKCPLGWRAFILVLHSKLVDWAFARDCPMSLACLSGFQYCILMF